MKTSESVEIRIFCLLLLSGRITGQAAGVKRIVREGEDVVLPCSLSTEENINSKAFDWSKDDQTDVFVYKAGIHYNNGLPGQDPQFRGRVSHFPEQLKNGNASIMIRNTKVADSGNYTCLFPQLQPPQRFNSELVVGASPEPYIRTLDATEDWSLLQCEVRGASPKPEVEWRDSAGNIVPAEEPHFTFRGDRYHVTLNTTVNKTCHFSCVVTQEEIHHRTAAHTYVYISVSSSIKEVIGWVGGGLLGAVAVLAVLALLVVTKRITISCNKGSQYMKGGPPSEILKGEDRPIGSA